MCGLEIVTWVHDEASVWKDNLTDQALAFFLVPIAEITFKHFKQSENPLCFTNAVEYFAFSSSDKRVNFLVVGEKA